MYLHFQNRGAFEKLHLTTALEDWDMKNELKLTTTTDQFLPGSDDYVFTSARNEVQDSCAMEPKESSLQPSLWMVVNPNLVCPCPGGNVIMEAPRQSSPGRQGFPAATVSWKESPPVLGCSKLDYAQWMPSSSSETMLTEDEDASSLEIPLPSKTLCEAVPPKRPKCYSRRLKYFKQKRIGQSEWPRPPINYCSLISLALSNSTDGSLNVQEIYKFVWEHFPFFQTAPDGWKNTIRHNLCFSNSFQKTTDLVCGAGKRKSCLWKLTWEGRRKFRGEIQALSQDYFGRIRESMKEPALMDAMFDL
ncbi:forkhead box protein R1 [Rhinatrema bivittatum]|uniref:forkhead box protein R1 n=1 Tax=Rhinatrema bivittatum TaxID=194408 RepID=UPI0011266723|nr:forkhead box protein R1 [Rhinatrema bivittatum]